MRGSDAAAGTHGATGRTPARSRGVLNGLLYEVVMVDDNYLLVRHVLLSKYSSSLPRPTNLY